MADLCEKCGLRCQVHFPGKKVPYSEENCPRVTEQDEEKARDKRMPNLARFNEILRASGKEEIIGDW